MGYYIRVLSTSDRVLPLNELESVLDEEAIGATLTLEAGTTEAWSQLLLCHTDGLEIAAIERNLVKDGSLGAKELEEFSEFATGQSRSSSKWLLEYFERVRCIYAFQVLSGAEDDEGWRALKAVRNRIWSFAPSILQADDEGFTNEEGDHIL